MKRIGMLVCALIIGLCGPVFSASNLKFATPPGWLNLSPGAPAENFTKIPEATAKAFKDAKVVAAAMDVDAKTGDGGANMVAEILHTSFPISETSMKEFGTQMVESASQKSGSKYTLSTTGILQISGVTCGRSVSETQTKLGTALTQVTYVLPDGPDLGIMTVTIATKHFKKNESALDEIARSVTGIRAPANADRMTSGPVTPVGPDRLLVDARQFDATDVPLSDVAVCGAGLAASQDIARPSLLIPQPRRTVSE
jgi:hypothetical protein